VNRLPALTIQQLRVVLQLAGGHGYKQAAFALGISVRTVRLHVSRIADRLDGDGSPKEKVLCQAERLIAAQSIARLKQAKAA
jgi:DNA-binding NarL/FixJ family response regulator